MGYGTGVCLALPGKAAILFKEDAQFLLDLW